MAQDWIKVGVDIFDHPKTLAFAGALDIDTDSAACKLLRLWTWAFKQAPDGHVMKWGARAVAGAIQFKGDAEKLHQALREAALIDENGRIHDWLEWGGALHKLRRATSERVEKSRSKEPCNSDVTVTPALNPSRVETLDSRVETLKSKSTPESTSKTCRFAPPQRADIVEYFATKGGTVEQATMFEAYYRSNGWKVGKNTMKEWKAAAVGWLTRDRQRVAQGRASQARDQSKAELMDDTARFIEERYGRDPT